MPAAAVFHRRFRSPFPRNPNSSLGRCSFFSSHSTLLSFAQSHRTFAAADHRHLNFAVLGAGFAGLSVTYHLLKHRSKESHLCIDIYDEVGIGGGASGVAGGLIHPYSPKAKALWRGSECWKECLSLIAVAESAAEASKQDRVPLEYSCSYDEQIVWRRGILRPATEKILESLMKNAQDSLEDCSLHVLDENAARNLVPDLDLKSGSAIYMPFGVNIHPKHYLEALFLACCNAADENSALDCNRREVNLYRKSLGSLADLQGKYDAVIICLGAKVNKLPELYGKLPLRTCRGIVAQLQLPNDANATEYSDKSPSILSDAWLAFQGPQNVLMGSTWDWNSEDYSCIASLEEASRALEELLPKASTVYPAIRKWKFVEARAGLRAMPPKTPLGSVPLLGCVDDAVRDGGHCKYWLLGGLGSRGLLYHGLLGKLTANAVLSCDENVIPPEFTSWKQSKPWRKTSF